MTTKTESKFYIGQTIIKTKNRLQNKIDAQTQKHIKARVITGRKFISDIKKNPGKQLNSFIDDNKNRVKEFTSDSKKNYQAFIDDSKTTMGKVVKGVTGDAQLIFDSFTSKKIITKRVNKIVSKNSITKTINNITAKIPSRLNLPSKEEIQELMTGVDGINKKIDKLNKLYA
jgi:hypothetical protein